MYLYFRASILPMADILDSIVGAPSQPASQPVSQSSSQLTLQSPLHFAPAEFDEFLLHDELGDTAMSSGDPAKA